MNRPRTERLPVAVTLFDSAELVGWLLDTIDGRSEQVITYATAHTLAEAWRSPDYAEAINRTSVCYADGYGVVIADRALDNIGLSKVTANDFFLDFTSELVKKGKRIALVGSAPGVANEVRVLIERKLDGPSAEDSIFCHSGYMDDEEEPALFDHLRAWQPDAIFVGMGQPRQETWALRAQTALPPTTFHCVGGLFDFLSGRIGQPPAWIRRAGFEWLYRLLDRPKENWRRYLLGIPYVAFRIVRTAIGRRGSQPGDTR